jgi:hypothetical protein
VDKRGNYVSKYGAEDRAWFEANVPSARIVTKVRMEAAEINAHLHDMLRVDVEEIAAEQVRVERNWVADCNRIVRERRLAALALEERQRVAHRAKMVRCGRIMVAYVAFVCALALAMWELAR